MNRYLVPSLISIRFFIDSSIRAVSMTALHRGSTQVALQEFRQEWGGGGGGGGGAGRNLWMLERCSLIHVLG